MGKMFLWKIWLCTSLLCINVVSSLNDDDLRDVLKQLNRALSFFDSVQSDFIEVVKRSENIEDKVLPSTDYLSE